MTDYHLRLIQLRQEELAQDFIESNRQPIGFSRLPIALIMVTFLMLMSWG